MKVIVDMDSTLVDIITPWMKHISKRVGRRVSKSDIVDYDVYQVLLDMGIERSLAASVFNIFADPDIDLYEESSDEPTFKPILNTIIENPDVYWILYTKSASNNI